MKTTTDDDFPHDTYLATEALRTKLAALIAERDLLDRAIVVISAVAALNQARLPD